MEVNKRWPGRLGRVETRAVAIVLRGDAVLLVRREDGYTLPGGEVGEHETAEQACVRSLREVSGLSGEIDEALWVLDTDDRTERYFLIGPVSGMASATGPDYEVVWADIQKLSALDLQPTLIRDQLIAVSEQF
jgi:ADP-ribose pyrophosphatase YjhB (NUDIX family)